jgi:glyoxylase-like metal-dependent hydrolase (beta-lactamase superfamily II)
MAYELTILQQGYPGKSVYHGGLGWSTVALVRDGKHNVLLDTGHYMHRDVLAKRLSDAGLDFGDITAVAITHSHWDHCVNFAMFPKAEIFIGDAELKWAAEQPIGKYPIAEFHVEKLLTYKNVSRIGDGDVIVPGIEAIATPGHTPGHMAYVAQGARGEYIYTGDAIKNGAELCSQRVDMTLDLARSEETIRRVRERAASNPQNVIVFGHDRCCSFDGSHVHEREPLRCALTARLGEGFDELTTFDLTRLGVTA